jgi:hypothetical protein
MKKMMPQEAKTPNSLACLLCFFCFHDSFFGGKKVEGYHEEDDASRGQNTQVTCLLALLLLFS